MVDSFAVELIADCDTEFHCCGFCGFVCFNYWFVYFDFDLIGFRCLIVLHSELC